MNIHNTIVSRRLVRTHPTLVAIDKQIDAEQWEAAEQALQEMLKSHPNEPALLIRLGTIARRIGLAEHAQTILEAARASADIQYPDQNPQDWALLLREAAFADYQLGNYPAAIHGWLDSLYFEDTVEARDALTACRLDDSRRQLKLRSERHPIDATFLKQAEDVCLEILRHNPKDAEAHFQLGNVMLLRTKPEEALPLLQFASISLTERADVFYSLGLAFVDTQHPTEAIAALKHSIALKADDEAMLELILLYLDIHRFDDALPLLEKAWAQRPEIADIYIRLLHLHDDKETALQVAKWTTEHFPTFALSWTLLARCHYIAGNNEDALTALFYAIHLSPDDDAVHSQIGALLHKMHAYELAEVAYRRALSLEKGKPQNYLSLLSCLTELKKFEQGRTLYQEALTHIGEDSDLEVVYSQLEYSAGNSSQALIILHAAISNKLDTLSKQDLEEQKHAPIPENYMAVQGGHQAILAAGKVFDRAGIPFFLIGGTLLGIIRNGDLLPFDKDMDFGLWWNTSRQSIHEAFRHEPDFTASDSLLDSECWVAALHHKPTDITIDLFFFKPEGDHFLEGFSRGNDQLLWKYRKFDICPIEFQGQSFMIPDRPEQFFEDIYGPNWRIPDPSFDAVVSGYNITPESKPIAMFFGYERLYSALQKHRWKKAKSYADQLRKWQFHPIQDKLYTLLTENNLL